MKASRYNLLFQASDGVWLAFNGWSTALAELEPDDLPFIQALLRDPDRTPCDTPHKREIREVLVSAHFLIDDVVDEHAALKSEMMRDRFRTDALYLTIAPTMDCNFRCDYCYEEHFRVTMSRAVQEALVAFVRQRAPQINLLYVTWFGGEPVLPRAVDVVRDLSRAFLGIVNERGITYHASLITNGYLLTRPVMEEMAGLGIKQVQITLDGPPPIHDRRRVLAGGQGTFGRIVENLKTTHDLAEFQVRINVDKRNATSALEVVEIMQREGIGQIPTYLAQVTSENETCGNINESCFGNEEFARTEVEIYREAARRGLPVSRYPKRLTGAFCTADRATGYVVAPNGALFKCWNHVTADQGLAVGHLLDGTQPFHRVNEDRFLAFDPLERKECPDCFVLPLCHGGCPVQALARPGDRGACEHYKFHLQPLLEIRHTHPRAGFQPSRGGVGENPC
jgi:uncharacterized protein